MRKSLQIQRSNADFLHLPAVSVAAQIDQFLDFWIELAEVGTSDSTANTSEALALTSNS